MPRGYGCRRMRGGDVQPRRISRFLEPVLLLLLQTRPTHAYGLIDSLDKLKLEAYPADVSAIYRILYDLEAAGMISSTRGEEESGGPPRRVYTLTEEGELYLRAWVQELRETDRILHIFLEAYDAQAAPEPQPDMNVSE
ncbi:MAG: PadR family transcriptional regulator [Anaerolineae bacterium]